MVSPAQCPNCRNIYMKYLVVFGGNNNISKENKMVDAYGAVTWWGFSPALDINNRQSQEILLVGAADLRHILKTCALRKRRNSQQLNFYIVENNLEVIARQLLFISIILESKESLGLKEKVELFLELFGNSLVRPQTDEFLRNKTNELIRFVTNPAYLEGKLPVLNLSNLKFKEHDILEGIFKFWRNSEQIQFDISALWDQRIRQHLKTRYDSRANAYDWDYTMKLKEKAPIINFSEYKTWRENGIAFELREDSTYEVPNRTLASGIIFNKGGEKVARRGYWGDIINSPYLSYGIESEEKSLFKKSNDLYVKMATNVSEHNITAWIYELMTGEEYSICPLKSSSMTKKLSPRTPEEKEGSGDKKETGITNANDQKEEAKKQREGARKATTCYFNPDGIKIHFLPLNSMADLPRKSNYKGLFDVIFFSNSMVHLMTSEIKPIIADNARIIVETSNFMLDLRHEHRVEYNKRIKGMAESLGFKMDKECGAEKDPFAFFSSLE